MRRPVEMTVARRSGGLFGSTCAIERRSFLTGCYSGNVRRSSVVGPSLTSRISRMDPDCVADLSPPYENTSEQRETVRSRKWQKGSYIGSGYAAAINVFAGKFTAANGVISAE